MIFTRIFLSLSFLGVLILLILGCAARDKPITPSPTAMARETPSPTAAPTMPEWDKTFVAQPCTKSRKAPLLDEALLGADLARSSFGLPDKVRESGYFLQDEFLLPWTPEMIVQPIWASCFENFTAGALDNYLSGPRPVANTIRHAAFLANTRLDEEWPITLSSASGDFDQVVDAICALAGPCDVPSGEIPMELKRDLTPVLWAIFEGIKARQEIDKTAQSHDASWWRKYGGSLLLPVEGEGVDVHDASERLHLADNQGRAKLYRAAAQIAYAIESVDWKKYRGLKSFHFDLKTGAGWISVYDARDNVYEATDKEVLLLLDLGGNDVHYDNVAANVSAENSVSVAIDLAGDDKYTYRKITTPYDRDGLPAADAAGRSASGKHSRSMQYRQGAGVNGIAMLFDLGEGNDSYESLRGSQGYAHLGVGVLFDEGGDDAYVSEDASQGSAQFGIALAIDAGAGKDTRYSFRYSQGFGYVGGVGVNLDGGGDDAYVCNHGDPSKGGILLYPSAQMPRNGNASFCQGAGFGRRGSGEPSDKPFGLMEEAEEFLSGGVGILRDLGGNDTFEVSVFGQGVGFGGGVGILSKGNGGATVDGYYYVQGAAAHYAVGIFAGAGNGSYRFNTTRPPVSVHLGAGHDFSLGVFIRAKGDDDYRIGTLGAGASNCNGIGVFVDNGGNDKYAASSLMGSGLGNVSEECSGRGAFPSIGVMVDAGGADSYAYPEPPSGSRVPKDGGVWGQKGLGLDSEYGIGLDGEGETAIHGTSR